MLSLGWVKAITAIALLLTAIAGGWIALRLCATRKCSRLLSSANALAGGFFLGAALLHLLPEAQESLAVVEGPLPWAMILCLVGFLLILLLEKLASAGGHHLPDTKTLSKRNPLYPYVLTIVLSLHSIIAGYALGAGATMNMVMIIFLAEVSHKLSAAFALGVSLVRSGMDALHLRRVLLLFALMTPFGILLGEFVSSRIQGQTSDLVSGIVNAIAAGTFLYVAIVDIIHEEFESQERLWEKFALLVCGLAFMALLAIWV
ncbi:ZIP family metal transporter [Candidatus Bipolaricaulota bacterium]|jgi:zinc transporter 1/2/3|nr:ZIP family metal transporter [Candidatus Bipolaricaulota bacterium]TFH10088.1 MAG: ZIP family metal transporter [Candidatus Atribacteria bacterium]